MTGKKFSLELLHDVCKNDIAALKNTEDVKFLFQLCNDDSALISFERLIFDAKYIHGLRSVLGKFSINEDRYMEKIFGEFSSNLEKFTKHLKSISESAEKSAAADFQKKYLRLDQENMVSLMSLIDDLSVCKEHLNNSEV